MTLTLAAMRADIAAQIDLPPADVPEDESLADLGLDSMQVMTLLMHWGETVPDLDFARFMEAETLADWWALVDEVQAA